jgi:hypothetical protein
MSWPVTPIPGRLSRRERGQVLVLFVLFLIVLLLAAVIAIDLGTYLWHRQNLEAAVDAAALAGALELPEDRASADSEALAFLQSNQPGVSFANCPGGQTPQQTPCVRLSYRCVVGDRDNNGSPDAVDIPASCNPGSGAAWSCADQLCVAQCIFVGSNLCNVMDVSASKEVTLTFTSVLGLPPLLISASVNGACRGYCGAAPTTNLDVIIVIDRSGSLDSGELAELKNGVRSVLELLDPELQHVGLAVLGAANPSNVCQQLAPSSGGNWLVVPLSDDYQNANGSLNTSSLLVSTINCIGSSSQGTDLGSPLSDSFYSRLDALDELQTNGRQGVAQGIIFFSDGAANEPDPMPGDDNPCQYAYDRATVVKDADVELFTIGYAVGSEDCNDDSGPYDNADVTELLANMATDSEDDQGGCANAAAVTAENNDGDHFLCQGDGGDLELVFITAASQLSGGVRLIGAP